MGKAVDYLSEKRLGMIKEAWIEEGDLKILPKRALKAIAGPMYLGTAELATRVGKIPVDMLSMLENTMGWAISGNVQEDMGNIIRGVKNLSFKDLGNITSMIGTSFVEDFKKGGLGITAGVIDTLLGVRRLGKMGGGIAEYLMKLGKSPVKAPVVDYAKGILKEFPRISEEIAERGIGEIKKVDRPGLFRRLFSDESLGSFGGGSRFLSVDPYEIKLLPKYFKKFAFLRGGKEVFDHEFGHAISRYVLDAAKFFEKRNIGMPENLAKMSEFIGKEVAVFNKPGFINLFKKPKEFMNSFVSIYGETKSLPDVAKNFAFGEKMAELFKLSRKGSKKDIVKKYGRIFSPEKLGEDLSKYVPDKHMDAWNVYMRKGVLGQKKAGAELTSKIVKQFTAEAHPSGGITSMGYDLAARVDILKGGSKKRYIESMKQARKSLLKRSNEVKGVSVEDFFNKKMVLTSQAQGIKEGLDAVKLVDAIKAGTSVFDLPKTSVSIATAREIIAGKRIPLPVYATGTDYVPSNQFAYLHKGEAVVPAEYNMGGVVRAPKFGLGGTVNNIKERATDLGEEIAKAIKKELEDIILSVDKTPLSIETTELTISNVESLDRLADTLSNLNTNVGVGADEASSKIDDFIEAANSKFENFTEIIERHDGDINEVQTSLFSLADSSREVNSLNDKLVGLEQSISDILSKQDFFVSTANDDSKLEAKLNELVKYIEDTHIARLNSDVRLSTIKIDKLDSVLNNALDLFDGLSSRFNLQEV